MLNLIAGSFMIAFGVFILLALKIPWLNYENRINASLWQKTGYARSFVIGAVFSVSWTACVGPILAGILALAYSEATAWHGAGLLAIYSLGLGLPFIAIGLAFDAFTPLLRRIQRYTRGVYVISGLLLIVIGILVLTNKLTWFASLAG
jgi:cytochrome c-type biogenesis protein